MAAASAVPPYRLIVALIVVFAAALTATAAFGGCASTPVPGVRIEGQGGCAIAWPESRLPVVFKLELQASEDVARIEGVRRGIARWPTALAFDGGLRSPHDADLSPIGFVPIETVTLQDAYARTVLVLDGCTIKSAKIELSHLVPEDLVECVVAHQVGHVLGLADTPLMAP